MADTSDVPSVPDHAGLGNETSHRAEREALEMLRRLWDAVKQYDMIGFEGSRLLEVMSDAHALLDEKGV